MDFKWTDEKVKMFTQIYSSNFQSKGLDENIFSYGNYHGKPLDEKMAQFKRDCLHLQFVDKKEVMSKTKEKAIKYLNSHGFKGSAAFDKIVLVLTEFYEQERKKDLEIFIKFLKGEGIVIEEEHKPQDFEFLYGVWSGANPDGLL